MSFDPKVRESVMSDILKRHNFRINNVSMKRNMSKVKPVGIINSTGSMCYLASAIQVLINSKSFVKFLESISSIDEDKKVTKFLKDVHKDISIMQTIANSRIINVSKNPRIYNRINKNYLNILTRLQSINDIMKKHGLSISRQEDSHHALIFLIDNVIEENKEHRDKFEGSLRVIRECKNCSSITTTEDKFLSIDMSFPKRNITRVNDRNSLYDFDIMVDGYLAENDTDIVCDKCKQKEVTERREFISIPDMMIMSLIPSVDNNGRRNRDIFDIAGVVEMETGNIYSISSVISHYGSLYGGHYVAKVKKNDTWYIANDHSISELSDAKTQVINESSYVVIYNRI